MSYRHF